MGNDEVAGRPAVGFVGLGVMGNPMAGHLADAGYPVTVFDIDRAAVRRLVDRCPSIRAADTPAAVATAAEIVVTMLPNGRIVQETVLADDGLLGGFTEGSLLLDTSSAEPWVTRETARLLAGKDVAMVDAPVSGAQWGAEAAELVFMVGGAESDVDRVLPLLDVLGRKTFRVGPLGAGHAMKSINNAITAMTFLATCEGLAVGKRYGLDPAAMNAVLNESTGRSWITLNHIEQRILSRSFDDPFRLELMLKDIGIAMQLSRDTEVPTPFSALGHELYRAASLDAGAGRSLSELARWVEKLSGTLIAPGATG